jgi:indolepyruvate ferredoxin oxidoreductase alpha subunit
MSIFDNKPKEAGQFVMGNQAIVRGALEAGVQFTAGYPGTPSSEIIENLSEAAQRMNIHAEWSTNEKVAAEGAAAAAFSGLRSLVAMKNAGLSVALDFLTHLSYTGLGDGGGAMLVVVCDDPNAHSSGDETDSRWLAQFASAPLVEASSVQEAKEITHWAFDLSQEFKCFVMMRGYTRLCHASGTVTMGELPGFDRKAHSDSSRSINPYLGMPHHAAALEKIEGIRECFEISPFNFYEGPKNPELIIVCGGSGKPCAEEALDVLQLREKAGILKLGTLWPLPRRFIRKHLSGTRAVLFAEEVDPFLEHQVKEMLADDPIQGLQLFGKDSGHVPAFGEITPDRVIKALSTIFKVEYEPRSEPYRRKLSDFSSELLISRGLTWCPGCPHRASFWAIGRAIKADGRDGYVTGDIGCYTLDVFPEGKEQMNILHAMGSGTGLAAGFGQLERFGYTQPVINICGDSTFFHAAVPALINAVHNQSDMILVLLDNAATAMTGFQSHPGTGFNAVGKPAQRIDAEKLCRSLDCKVTVSDPFDIKGTVKTVRGILKESGVRVLILRRNCEIVRMKREKAKPFSVKINEQKCKGKECAVCSSEFRCPALFQDENTGKTRIKEDICSGCGVCVDICPFKSIIREESGS